MAMFFVDCVMVECNAAFDHEHFTIADCCVQGQELWRCEPGRNRRERLLISVMMKMRHLIGSSAAAAAAA